VKIQILKAFVVAFVLSLGGTVLAAGPAASGAVYANENTDGTVELSNISSTENEEPLVAAPESAAAAAVDPGAVTDATTKDPREQYRDKVMQAPEVATPATTNASRRYKKVDLATYRATMLGNTAPTPQGGASAAR
jgi:hypothetical protein